MDRPSAAESLEHPLFWSNKRKVYFLKAVSSHEKFTKKHDPNIEAALKNSMERGRWNNKNKYKHMSKLHTEMSKSREVSCQVRRGLSTFNTKCVRTLERNFP